MVQSNCTKELDKIIIETLSLFPHGCIIIDRDYHILYMNNKWINITAISITEKEAIHKFLWEIFDDSMYEAISTEIKECFLHGNEREMKGLPLPSSTSETQYVDLKLQLFGEQPFMLLSLKDAIHPPDQLRKVKNTLLMNQVLDHIKDPIFVCDREGNQIYSNNFFCQLFAHLDPESLHLNHLIDIYSFYDFKGKELSLNQLPFSKILESEPVYDAEIQLVHKTNKYSRFFYVTTEHLQSNFLDTSCFLIIFRDVTKELRQEQSRKEFIQIAAHELRTPLTAIKGFTQLVLERFKEREKKWFFQPMVNLIEEIKRDQTFFNIIWDEAHHLDEVTNELLSIFKIDQGKFELKYEQIDLVDYMYTLLEEFVLPTDEHEIIFETNVESALVKIDIQKIKRVIFNLLSNAIKYSPNHSNVYVKLERENQKVTLYVQDKGLGIPEEQQKHIFDRFFRVHSESHEGIEGYGVGLHICKEVIELHQGKLDLKSKYGEGSTFYFSLPIIDVISEMK